MLVENSKINKEIKDNRYKKEKMTLNKKRIWSQKSSFYFRNIMYDIDRYLKNIKQSRLLLYEVDTNKKRKANNAKNEEKKKINLEIIIDRETGRKTSKKFSKYMSNIYKRIKDIKDETNELKMKEGKSLKNISMNYSRTPRPIIVVNNKKEKKLRPTSASTYYESKMFELITNKTSRNKQMKNSFKSFREGNIIKSAESKDFSIKDLKYNNFNKRIIFYEKKGKMERLNEMYRTNINRAIKMYTPIGNLKQMKQLQIEDVEMKKNYNNLNEKISKRIKDRCGGFFYKKKYDYYNAKNKTTRINVSQSFKNIDKNKKILILRPRNNSSKNSFYQKLKFKKEEEKTEKEKIKQKKESLKNILELLKNSLEIEKIQEYINDKVKSRNRIRKDIKIDKEKYFSNLEKLSKNYEEISKNKDWHSEENNINNIIKTKELISKDNHFIFN